MAHLLVLSAFGFDTTTGSPPESIYPYAPVYRVEDPAGEWIVKRSQKSAARAQAVAAWTRSLKAGGIPVVTAAAGFGENPRGFTAGEGSEEFWVVYPFIQGRVYSGDLEEMRAAGELLGRIHMHAAGTEFGLKINPIVVAIEEQEIRGDMDANKVACCSAC